MSTMAARMTALGAAVPFCRYTLGAVGHVGGMFLAHLHAMLIP